MKVDKTKWEKVRLGEMCEFLSRGKSPKYDDSQRLFPVFAQKCNLKEGGISLRDVRFLDPTTVDKWQDVYKLLNEDILINSTGTGTVGRVGIFKTELLKEFPFIVPDSHVSVVRLKHNLYHARFMYYALRGHRIQKYFEENLHGSTNQKELYINTVKNTKIDVPSLPEQQTIAAELDAIQSVIDKLQEQLRDYDTLAKSIFNEMFGNVLNNSRGWHKSSYESHITITSGGTPSKSISEYWDNGDIPWIGSNMCTNSILYKTDGKFITKKGFDNSSAKLFPKGTVLIALVGATIGKTALLATETTTNQNIAGLTVKDCKELVPLYVFFHTMQLYPLFLNIGGGKFTISNQKFIKKLPLVIPPISLQRQFAERIESIEAQKSLLRQQITDARQLMDSRMQYYFG